MAAPMDMTNSMTGAFLFKIPLTWVTISLE
jgi:hypothetical protein